MRFSVLALDFFERDVRLRMPFRFGIATMKIRNRNGRTQAALSIFDRPLWAFNSATLLSRLVVFSEHN